MIPVDLPLDVLAHAPMGVMVGDPARPESVYANEAMLRILRVCGPPEAWRRQARAYHADGCPYGRGDWPLERLCAGGAPVDGEELEVLRMDGSWATVAVTTFRVGGLAAAVTEPRDSRRGREYLDAEREVDRILASSATIEEAAPRVLAALGGRLGWALAILYAWDGGRLLPRHVWGDDAALPEDFVRMVRTQAVGPGEGFSGQVWADGSPRWLRMADVDSARLHQRIGSAELRQAVGIPVRARHEPAGVLTLAALHDRPPDPELMRLAENAATGLSHLLLRQRAEEALHLSNKRLRAVVDSVPAAIFMVDAESPPARRPALGRGHPRWRRDVPIRDVPRRCGVKRCVAGLPREGWPRRPSPR